MSVYTQSTAIQALGIAALQDGETNTAVLLSVADEEARDHLRWQLRRIQSALALAYQIPARFDPNGREYEHPQFRMPLPCRAAVEETGQ